MDPKRLYLRIVYVLLMAGWSSYICDDMLAREATLTLRWGTQEISGTASLYDEYDQEADDAEGDWSRWREWIHVSIHRTLGNVLTLVAMFWIVATAGALNVLHEQMVNNPGAYEWLTSIYDSVAGGSGNLTKDTKHLGNSVVPFLITINNRITGMIWDGIARWIVTKENHKMLNEIYESLAVKLYVVYLFNWSYPFIYIAFFKRLNEGCASTDATGQLHLLRFDKPGFEYNFCVLELKASLLSFFKISAVIDFLLLIVNWAMARYKIASELKNARVDEKTGQKEEYTYIEVQAKLAPANLVLDDMTVFVVNFSFLCAFTYACPMLAVYAFFYNCIICNWYMWSHLRLQRRAVPIRCQGMPVWNSLMRFSMFFAVVVNAGMAACVVDPMASRNVTLPHLELDGSVSYVTIGDTETKLWFFVILEHALFLMIVILMMAVPDVPREAIRRQENNDDYENLLMDPMKHEHHELPWGTISKVRKSEISCLVFQDDHKPKV